jgi:hypothetical protein
MGNRAALSLAAALLGSTGLPALAVSEPTVPPALRARADEVPAFMLTGNGAYVYQCKPTLANPDAYTWSFLVPDATLYDGSNPVARHASVDIYEANNDASSLTAVVRSAAAAGAGNLPWAAFNARGLNEKGLFAGVTGFQRVNTKGGGPPSAGCDASHAGDEARQTYTADYYFYRKRGAP